MNHILISCKNSTTLIFTFLFLSSSPVSQASYFNSEFGDASHSLSQSGGVSSPSRTSSLNENPAGLIFQTRSEILGAVASSSTQLSPLGGMGAFFAGNGAAGGGLSVQSFNAQGSTVDQLTLLRYGLATDIPQLNLSLGATGTHVLKNRGVTQGAGTDRDWDTDVGILINPNGSVRVGLALYQILSGIQAIGVGISADPNPNATLAIDASMTPQTRGKVIKPSLGIHLDQFQISYGYGIRVDSDDTPSWIRSGSTFGVGVQLGYSFHLQFYYNQMAQYFFGLGLQF